jgi:hypothetical protein
VNALTKQPLVERAVRPPDLPSAEGLDQVLRAASPAEVIESALKIVGR